MGLSVFEWACPLLVHGFNRKPKGTLWVSKACCGCKGIFSGFRDKSVHGKRLALRMDMLSGFVAGGAPIRKGYWLDAQPLGTTVATRWARVKTSRRMQSLLLENMIWPSYS